MREGGKPMSQDAWKLGWMCVDGCVCAVVLMLLGGVGWCERVWTGGGGLRCVWLCACA